MGYYTDFTLKVEPESERDTVMAVGTKRNEWFKDVFNDRCKWYDWADEMRAISAALPDVVIHLHGEGEEGGDIWDATFVGGKMHHRKAKVVIDPFDPKMLK